MMLKFREWLADHFSSVQYPVPRVMPRPANPLPFWKRYVIFVFSMIALAISAVLLFFICLIVYTVVMGLIKG